MIVRELRDASEAVQVEELQLAAWGRNEREVVPRGILVAIQLQGGLLAGAFAEEAMIGFVLGFPTARPQVQHSHMLAVAPERRGGGAALALKSFQRDWCLARGVGVVEWTFDPLRGPNANFNLRKLGAVIARYHPDLYGAMSGINAGVASDRALARWDLNAARVERALGGELPPPDFSGVPTINPKGPTAYDDTLRAPALRFVIPEDFGALVSGDLPLAQAWRAHGRAVLQHYLAQGYLVTGFGREGGNAYLLEKSPSF